MDAEQDFLLLDCGMEINMNQEKERYASGGCIMQLQNYSVNDGDGIRTDIFLAGCPLRCRWCSNPEGQTLHNPMTRYMTVEEVVAAIRKQRIFYRYSGGGVTFSGGEATMQTGFLRTLTERLYDMGISLALETCGCFDFDEVKDILEKMNLIFCDIKLMSEEKHRQFTGVSNQVILQNIPRIASLDVPLVIRIPVIHGVNTDEENLKQTFCFIREHAPHARLELLPYHTFGEEKYRQLGLELPPASFGRPAEAELAAWEKTASEMGIKTISFR